MICENIEKYINMKNTPIDYDIVNETIDEMSIPDFGKATIREVVAIASRLEEKTGQEFIHMEMGVPGLPPAAVGVEAEIEALRNGVASIYPVIDGLPRLKKEAARFVKAFIDVDVDPQGCVPVVGSMQGTFTSFLVAGQCNPEKDTILFIDPGFPVQKQQIVVLGYKYEAFEEISFGKNWKVIWKKEISLLLFIPIPIILHGYVSKMKS